MAAPKITELSLTVLRDSEVRQTIPSQLAEQLRQLILTRTLRPGDRLPATRALAARLGVSRGSVVAAYEQLGCEGFVEVHGKATRVAAIHSLGGLATAATPSGQHTPAAMPENKALRTGLNSPLAIAAAGGSAPSETIDMRPGKVATDSLATVEWRSAWRGAAAQPTTEYPPQGSLRLRAALAEHLRVTRGLTVSPAEIHITSGAREGLALLISAFSHSAAAQQLSVAIEDPGYPSLQRVPQALGHRTVTIPVTAAGIAAEMLPRGITAPDIVLVTPSHQYPLGGTMTVDQRLALLTWARTHGSIIVEDDYDSELRYTGDPLPPLAALDTARDCVATLGSFSKLLTPGLGLGYLLAPLPVQQRLLRLRSELGSPVSSIVQDAMTEFLRTGGARRHTAKMLRRYRQLREILAAGLAAEKLPEGVRLLPMAGGLHAVLQFPCGGGAALEREFCERALAEGVRVNALGDYWQSNSGSRDIFGVVLGFAALSPAALKTAAEVLCRVAGAVVGGPKSF